MQPTSPAATAAAPAPAAGKPKLLIVVIVLMVLLLAGGGAGAWYYLQVLHAEPSGTTAATPVPKAPAQYLPLNPAFVVNLSDDHGQRYLQADVELMSRDPLAVESINRHMPLIRNRLMLLFSQKRAEELRTRQDKERLQSEALAETQKVLTEETGKPWVEALYFTSIVTQ